ncbi:unnamed protein product [Ranitomeya imitator]|uniref:Uncharacterized protein n=1 Tax=Ranitomeya imitator TaxID=111125 RepID=A0ABN9KQU6_9NEOB|nr:unnamed protein product [Ranitomeya imitator]
MPQSISPTIHKTAQRQASTLLEQGQISTPAQEHDAEEPVWMTQGCVIHIKQAGGHIARRWEALNQDLRHRSDWTACSVPGSAFSDSGTICDYGISWA